MVAEKIEYRMGALGRHIAIEGLSFGYREAPVLREVSARIPEGKFTVVLGRNGSGKSTLLRLAAGLLPCSEGRIEIGGRDLKTFSPRERARELGFLAQQHKPVFPFTVEEVVLTGRAAYVRVIPSAHDREVVGRVLEKAGITHLRQRLYTELSGGEQQLVMIARALAQEAGILLLDEPVSHLDYNNQLRVMRLLRQLAGEGITVAAVLHDPNLAFWFGEHFLLVHEGRVQACAGEAPWEDPLVGEVFYEGRLVRGAGGEVFMGPGRR